MGKLSLCAKIFLAIHLIVTAFFVALGCVVLAVGIYLQVESRNFEFITGSSYASGAILLILSGIVTLFISVIGFVGGCLRWRPLLVLYAIIVTIIIIIEIVAGIVGFVFCDATTDESEDRYHDTLTRAIEQFDTDPDAERLIQYLQNGLSCCGIDGPSDWGTINGTIIWMNEQQLPESCQCTGENEEACGVPEPFTYSYNISDMTFTTTYTSSNTVWTTGCYNRTADAFIDYALVSFGTALAFGVFEILAVIIALGLACCITCAKKNDKYVYNPMSPSSIN